MISGNYGRDGRALELAMICPPKVLDLLIEVFTERGDVDIPRHRNIGPSGGPGIYGTYVRPIYSPLRENINRRKRPENIFHRKYE